MHVICRGWTAAGKALGREIMGKFINQLKGIRRDVSASPLLVS